MNFFVYGTLKEGGFFAGNFDSLRKTCRKATLKGYDMYGIGHSGAAGYPGIIPGEGIVHGEIHSYDKKDMSAILKTIDNIEGYEPSDQENSLYLRKKVTVKLEDGTEERVMVYIFNRPIQNYYDKIKSGVWDV